MRATKGQEPSDGSKPLASPKREVFCQLFAAGETRGRAYEVAGFTSRTPEKAGSDLLKKPEVAARVAALVAAKASTIQSETTKAAENAGIDKTWVMSRLKEVAERCLQNAPVLDAKGELVMVETKDGLMAPAYKFDSKGAVGALVPLGKELGMFVERSIVTLSALEQAPEEQVDAYILQAAKELGIDLPADAPKH